MKLFYLIIFLFSINCYSQDEFITVWKTDNISPSNSIFVPIIENTSDLTYSWQQLDTYFNPITLYSAEVNIPANNGPFYIHFLSPGIYRLKISTQSEGFRFKNDGSIYENNLGRDLVKIENWGNINWSSFEGAFERCINLDITATDIPNLSNVYSLKKMFTGCSNLVFNTSISFWNVENITTFEEMFNDATLFNQDINKWNTSNATSFKLMFAFALQFNQPLNSWDVSNAEDFYGMFHGATNFDKPLNEWQTDYATDMAHMFCYASNFNQDISNFNVSNVNDLSWFLNSASSFNQDLSSLQLNSIINGTYFFDNSGLDCTNFTNTIQSWSNNLNLPNYITLGVLNMKYNNSLIPTLEWLTNTKNWTLYGNMTGYENCSLNTFNTEKTLIKIYPNPTSHFINIEGLDVEKVDIYDAKGSLVQKTLNNNQVDISNLSSGNYIIIINNQHKENIIKK